MNNVHEDAPVVFHTRWAMSYLCGPLTRGQIKTLMDPVRASHAQSVDSSNTNDAKEVVDRTLPSASRVAGNSPWRAVLGPGSSARPVLPAGIHEEFAAISERLPDGFQLEYRPALLGRGKVHFVRKGDGVDVWRECCLLQSNDDAPAEDVWQDAVNVDANFNVETQPDDRGRFADLPSEMAREKSYAIFARHLKEHLYREQTLKLWTCPLLKQASSKDETEASFRARLAPMLEAKRIAEREKIDQTHAKKMSDADDRLRKAQATLSAQRWQFFARLGSMAWVVADTVLSVLGKGLPGRRRSIDPALRSVATERGQQSNAQISVESALKEKQTLELQHQEQLKQLEAKYNPSSVPLESIELKPQKSDIEIDKVSLVWLPWRVDSNSAATPVY
jgi:hypothetical protein